MKTVQFAAKFEYLDEIREFVGTIARDGGFGDKDVYNIQLATDEAASNIIEHAYENIKNGVLELSCGVKDDLITIVNVIPLTWSQAVIEPRNDKFSKSCVQRT